MGAQVFCNIGYGDDGTPNGGVFHDLDVWIEQDLIPSIITSNGHSKETSNNNNRKNSNGNRIPRQSLMRELRFRYQPISPYEIVVSSTKTKNDGPPVSISLDENSNSSPKQEWQMQQYTSFYNDFFQSLRPRNAYMYDPSTGYRLSAADCNHNNNKNVHESQNNKNMNDPTPRLHWPLNGHVLSNERLTSEGWIQDTRHIQIHVDTGNFHRNSTNSRVASKVPTNTNKPCHNQETVPLPYRAGDIATIIPFNPKSIVQKFLNCLPLSIQSKADIPLSIATKILPSTQYKANYTPWPAYCTLRGLLTHCADISSLPEREDLRSLSVYCNPKHPMGKDQQSKLVSLSETTDAALYGDYVIREKRNWADVLFDFDSIRYEDRYQGANFVNDDDDDDLAMFTPLGIEHLLMILSPIMPRHFSIASAPSSAIVQGNESGYVQSSGKCGFSIELCVAVVNGSTPHGRQFQGLCSTYLSGLGTSHRSEQNNLKLWIRPGSFSQLPLDFVEMTESMAEVSYPSFKTPIMCIGAGTGIAPLRSLVCEREATRAIRIQTGGYKKKPNDGELQSVDNILVFGCRKRNEDFYYQDEWNNLIDSGSLKVLTAFSQDQKKKVYVQHIIRESDQGLLIAKHILENSGAVYVAGGAKMARAVKDEILESLGNHLPNGMSDAKKLLSRLQHVGKFCVEAWS